MTKKARIKLERRIDAEVDFCHRVDAAVRKKAASGNTLMPGVTRKQIEAWYTDALVEAGFGLPEVSAGLEYLGYAEPK